MEILGRYGQIDLVEFEKVISFCVKQLSSNINRVKELAYVALVHLYSTTREETRVIVESNPTVRGP